MPGGATRFRILALVLTAAAVGCGRSPVSPSARAHWHAHPLREEDRWDFTREMNAPLVLPEARLACETRVVGIDRLTANQFSDGNVLFRGKLWPLGTGTEEERSETLRALKSEFGKLASAPQWREPDGTTSVPFMLVAARDVRWREVRVLLLTLTHDCRPGLANLQWAAQGSAGPHGLRQEGRATSVAADAWARRALALQLGARAVKAGSGEVFLTIEGRTWAFGPAADSFDDPPFLTRANRAWDEAAAHLARVVGSRTCARLETRDGGDEVPWAYLVKAFDLLLERGVLEVYLPQLEVRLDLAPPAPPDSLPREDDGPVLTTEAVGLAAGAVVVAVTLTFLLLLARRRRAAAERRDG